MEDNYEENYTYNPLLDGLIDEKDWELYEKFQELKSIYGYDILFHCNKCNKDDFVFSLNEDKSCCKCNAPKENIELIEDLEKYKKLYIDGILIEDEVCKCDNCGEPYSYRECILDNLKCPECKKIIKKKLYFTDYCEEPEEFEYHCENCGTDFTSTLTEDVKCPKCHMVNENPEPITPEDMEPDWELGEEYYESLFDMED